MLTRYHSDSRRNGHSIRTIIASLYVCFSNEEQLRLSYSWLATNHSSDHGSRRIFSLLRCSGSHQIPDSLTRLTDLLVSIIAFRWRIILIS